MSPVPASNPAELQGPVGGQTGIGTGVSPVPASNPTDRCVVGMNSEEECRIGESGEGGSGTPRAASTTLLCSFGIGTGTGMSVGCGVCAKHAVARQSAVENRRVSFGSLIVCPRWNCSWRTCSRCRVCHASFDYYVNNLSICSSSYKALTP